MNNVLQAARAHFARYDPVYYSPHEEGYPWFTTPPDAIWGPLWWAEHDRRERFCRALGWICRARALPYKPSKEENPHA